MNNKVYARRLYIEDTSIYWDILKDDLSENNYFIYGNKDFEGVGSDFIKWLYDTIINYSNYEVETYYRNNIASYFIDNLRSKNIHINLKQALNIKTVLKSEVYNNIRIINDQGFISAILSIIYCEEYSYYIMRGYCQGDWQVLYYPRNKDLININYIEAVYFGTGEEIEIHDGENIPQSPEEITGYTFYTWSYNVDDIKYDIAKETGADVKNIIFYDIKDVKEVRSVKIEYTEGL